MGGESERESDLGNAFVSVVADATSASVGSPAIGRSPVGGGKERNSRVNPR